MGRSKKGRHKPAPDKKKEASYHHTKLRFKQRYGMDVSRRDLVNITKLIQTGASEKLFRRSLSRCVHKVTYRDVKVVVVYCTHHKSVVTALPPNVKSKEFDLTRKTNQQNGKR